MKMRLAAIVLAGLLVPAIGQEGVKRTPLGTIDFPPGYQAVMGYAELAPNTCAGRHTHPGAETSYILEKEVTLKINGQPDRTLKAGDSFQLPVGVLHDACTSSGVKILTVHIIEKGKPLASPAQ